MANTVNDTIKLAEKLMNNTKRRHNDQLLPEINDKKLRESNKLEKEEIAAKQVEDCCNRWNKYLEKAKQRDSHEHEERDSLIDRLRK